MAAPSGPDDFPDTPNKDPWRRRLCPVFRCALPKTVGAISIILTASCIAAHFSAAWTKLPVSAANLWLMTQLWIVFLLACACRARLAKWVSGLASLAAPAGPRGPQRRRTTKTTHTGQGPWFSFASCEMQGWREAMEDAVVCAPDGFLPREYALFAVFDGHGGSEVSARAAEQIVERVSARMDQDPAPGDALKQALLDIEDDLRRHNTLSAGRRDALPSQIGRSGCRYDFVGCTAAVALLSSTAVAVVNIGDSRVFKCRNGECVPLTRDHKPESPRERHRIESAGGTVVKFGPCYRIDFNLNLSRSLGDFQYKDPNLAPEDQKISPVGDVTTMEIDEQDEFLVVACDGLFELMTWNSVCEFIHQRIQRMPLAKIVEDLLEACCTLDTFATCGRGTDNESVIIVKLHDH